jgi:hypothetical protein
MSTSEGHFQGHFQQRSKAALEAAAKNALCAARRTLIPPRLFRNPRACFRLGSITCRAWPRRPPEPPPPCAPTSRFGRNKMPGRLPLA